MTTPSAERVATPSHGRALSGAVHGDPVGAGLVSSLTRPGGNITGLSLVAPELSGKRLQLLKEVVPTATRVAAIWNGSNVAAAR